MSIIGMTVEFRILFLISGWRQKCWVFMVSWLGT